MRKPGCVPSAFLSIPAGIVIGIAATYIAPYWGVCRSDQAMRIMLFTYSIGSGVSFFAIYLRSGGFLRSFFAAIAVMIIAFIPAGIALAGLTNAPDAARRKHTTEDIRKMATAIEAYKTDHPEYPVARDVDALAAKLRGYGDPISRRDGWGNPFLVNVQAKTYEVRSCGACGAIDRTGEKHQYRYEDDLVFRDGAFVDPDVEH